MSEALQTVAAGPVVGPVAGESIEALLARAIDRGVPVETMERLLAMRRELKAEAAKEAFTASMARFQASCPPIQKTEKVMEKGSAVLVRYRYASLDGIVSTVKQSLQECGFSYSVDATVEPGFVTATCRVTHALGHSETSTFKVPVDARAAMSEPQKFASALTFAKRYAFCGAFGLVTTDLDDDAQEQRRPAATKWGAAAAESPTGAGAVIDSDADERKKLKNAIWAAAPTQRGVDWATYHRWMWDEGILAPDERTKDLPASRLAEVLAAVTKKVRQA